MPGSGLRSWEARQVASAQSPRTPRAAWLMTGSEAGPLATARSLQTPEAGAQPAATLQGTTSGMGSGLQGTAALQMHHVQSFLPGLLLQVLPLTMLKAALSNKGSNLQVLCWKRVAMCLSSVPHPRASKQASKQARDKKDCYSCCCSGWPMSFTLSINFYQLLTPAIICIACEMSLFKKAGRVCGCAYSLCNTLIC